MAKISFPGRAVNIFMRDYDRDFKYIVRKGSSRTYVRKDGKFVPIGWWIRYTFKGPDGFSEYGETRELLILDSQLK